MIFVSFYLVTLYVSIIGFLSKCGYSIKKTWIPFYNLYLFFRVLKISPILLILLALGLIFLEDRVLIMTIMIIFLPFICAYTFNKKIIWAIIALIFPFPGYILLSFTNGGYLYEERRNDY